MGPALWELFCTVVDNYGDIGVTWRLARQLHREHGLRVRLWVDDLVRFHALCPAIDPQRPLQWLEGVEVHRLSHPFPEVPPGDVVIEAFGCTLPQNHLQAMAARVPKPVWIDLEYLSAEDWVTGCHGLPSPHPRLPLTRWFFFPGFAPGTGGLLYEAGLTESVHAFRTDPEQQREFWAGLGIPPAQEQELRVSLFGYENPAVRGLLRQWSGGQVPVRCLVPAGRIIEDVLHALGRSDLMPGQALESGRLTVHCLPMLRQEVYDRLLWACDCNFVRGEDSFVRAQWASRPFVWQAYPQAEGAHWAKIEAFLARYAASLPQSVARDLAAFWRAWNAGGGVDWPAFWRHRPALESHARLWSERLLKLGDLATNLVRFCQERL